MVRRRSDERGAAAVEFAMVAMVLVTLVMGIMEFGYAFFVQGTIAGAAREGARDYAIHGKPAQAIDAAVSAGSSVGVTNSMVTISGTCPSTPPAGTMPAVTVTIAYPDFKLTGFFGSYTLTGKGTMRCGG